MTGSLLALLLGSLALAMPEGLTGIVFSLIALVISGLVMLLQKYGFLGVMKRYRVELAMSSAGVLSSAASYLLQIM